MQSWMAHTRYILLVFQYGFQRLGSSVGKFVKHSNKQGHVRIQFYELSLVSKSPTKDFLIFSSIG
jgi:hypothetical protein